MPQDAIDGEYTVIADDAQAEESSRSTGPGALGLGAAGVLIALVVAGAWFGPGMWRGFTEKQASNQAAVSQKQLPQAPELSAPLVLEQTIPPAERTPVTAVLAAQSRPPSLTSAAEPLNTQPSEAQTPNAVFSDCTAHCPAMVTVRGGEFLMGATNIAFQADRDETPAHPVVVRDFAVALNAVTLSDWLSFVQATGRAAPASDCLILTGGDWKKTGSWRNPGFVQADNHPVTCINEADALDYVAWLSSVTRAKYRLLREEEWEFIARNPARPSTLAISAQPIAAREAGTAPAGKNGPNELGLFDMPGDVWEMTSSCYTPDYQSPAALSEDGRCALMAVRGRSWRSSANSFRATQRNGVIPSLRSSLVGFRVARDL